MCMNNWSNSFKSKLDWIQIELNYSKNEGDYLKTSLWLVLLDIRTNIFLILTFSLHLKNQHVNANNTFTFNYIKIKVIKFVCNGPQFGMVWMVDFPFFCSRIH
jgi:hypothetical protein